LPAAPPVKCTHLVYAAKSTAGTALFFGIEFALNVLKGILGDRYSGVAATLRTPVHQAIFTDVQISGAGAALPVVLVTGNQVTLE